MTRLFTRVLDDVSAADVIHARAFLNWANRLMLPPGEPTPPDETA